MTAADRRSLEAVTEAGRVLARRLGDEQRGRRALESRIKEVRRWMGAAFADGQTVEAAFLRVRETMTEEEREQFLHDFLESCGSVVRGAGRRLRDALVNAGEGGTGASDSR
ncbi:MAG: hypothetical protein JXB32_14870 [Deltaproteobacteria bacterium]|nr:hypothetical protein [Deltaproteobacteria bacterium]